MSSIIGSRRGFAAIRAKKHADKNRFKPKPKCYEARKDNLHGVGYSNYAEYLTSTEWKKLRLCTLRKDKLCFVCRKNASQVHHLDYHPETLLGWRPNALISICARCHEKIEFDDAWNKVTLEEANLRLVNLLFKIGGKSRVKELSDVYGRRSLKKSLGKKMHKKLRKNGMIP